MRQLTCIDCVVELILFACSLVVVQNAGFILEDWVYIVRGQHMGFFSLQQSKRIELLD